MQTMIHQLSVHHRDGVRHARIKERDEWGWVLCRNLH